MPEANNEANNKATTTIDKPVIGWREWVDLSSVGAGMVLAKIDTGAFSSALHAEKIEKYVQGGKIYLRFLVDHPGMAETSHCVARLRDWRMVKSSNGKSSLRPIVQTFLTVGDYRIKANITLADRSEMEVPMLLGRAALRRRFIVEPSHSFLLTNRVMSQKRRKDKPTDKLNRANRGCYIT